MTSPVMQALVNVRLHEASARRGVPTHARVLAGEGSPSGEGRLVELG